MSPLVQLAVATAAFVGLHFLLSHPLRRPLTARMGERRFLGLYAAVALAAFVWMVVAARAVDGAPPRWIAPGWAWPVAEIVMLVASILLVGSLIGNPAAPNPDGRPRPIAAAKGVYAVSRHPMLWSFVLWAVVHAALWPTSANLIVSAGIATLALLGAWAQDRKKERLLGEMWRGWEARTAFYPFAGQLAGDVGWRSALPAPAVLAGGVALWAIAGAVHVWLGAPAVGLPRWLG